jgi:DNA-3-methyladenine glycosylase II
MASYSTQVRSRSAARLRRARVELRAVAPFDFDFMLRYLRIWPAAVLERIEDGGYRRAVHIGGHDVLLSMHSIGTRARPRLMLEVSGAGLDGAVVEQAAALVRRTFLLDADPAPFLQAAQSDPVLAEVVGRLGGVRPVQIIDPFEATLWTILGQQINLAFARRLKLALIDMCASHLEIGGERFALFPRPEQVVHLDPQLARERQFSRQKTEYTRIIAAAVISGQVDFEALRSMPAEQALAALTAVKGIGRWTAEYLLIRTLGFPDAIPAADVGLRKSIGQAYGLGRTATEQEVRELAERWRGWRGWAAFYWWLERLLALYPI